MKKTLFLLVTCVLLLGLVASVSALSLSDIIDDLKNNSITGFASKKTVSSTSTTTSTNNGNGNSKGKTTSTSTTSSDTGTGSTPTSSSKKPTKEEVTQTFLNSEGEEVQITATIQTKERDGKIYQKIKVKGYEVESELELEQEDENGKTKLKAKLSNGNKAEVKVMPNTASQTAIAKLQSKNITIVLKEVGTGNNTRVVYEAKGNTTVKFLGLFKVRTELTAIISAETGEVLRLEKPWWYFLAFGEGAVNCNINDLDLCDDEPECTEAGLIWFNNTCATGCPEDGLLCEDNETMVYRNESLSCEFNECIIIIEPPINETNQTIPGTNQTIPINETNQTTNNTNSSN